MHSVLEEFLLGLLNSLIFMLIGAAYVLGRRCFASRCTSTSISAANAWQRAWKQLVHSSLWLGRATCNVKPRPAVGGTGTTSSLARPNGAGNICDSFCAPAEEQLASEVALLLKRGRLLAAVELLRSVRMAGGALQPGLSCFRMVWQRLACSPPKPNVIANVTQEMSCHSLPSDALTQSCYVRYLCRASSVDVETAHDAYNVLLATGVPPDLRTVECLVEACLRMDRHDLVKPLILDLDNHGLEPSPTLYAELIVSCAATGAVACGMVAFEQMRPHFQTDLAATQLGYSSAIYMCTQNQQVERALKLLEESRQLSSEQGLPPADLEARLLPALLAAAVQTGRTELALDLAHRARTAIAATAGSPKGRELAAYLEGLRKLLLKRHASSALMVQVSAILADAPAGLHVAAGAAQAEAEVRPPAGTEFSSSSSMFRLMRYAFQLLGAGRSAA